MITFFITESYQFNIFDKLVLKLQHIETEIIKLHYNQAY